MTDQGAALGTPFTRKLLVDRERRPIDTAAMMAANGVCTYWPELREYAP
jgi:hypothetical protein